MDPVELCAEDSNHLYYQQHVDLEKDQMIRKLLFICSLYAVSMWKFIGLSTTSLVSRAEVSATIFADKNPIFSVIQLVDTVLEYCVLITVLMSK